MRPQPTNTTRKREVEQRGSADGCSQSQQVKETVSRCRSYPSNAEFGTVFVPYARRSTLATAGRVLSVSLEPQPARDDVAWHLGRPGIDCPPDGVAQRALDLVLGHVAIAAMNLNRVQGRLHKRFAHEQLGHGGVHRHRARLAEARGGTIGEQARRFERHLHIDDLVRDGLALPDARANLRAWAAMRPRALDQWFDRADVRGEEAGALPVHRVSEDSRARPDGAKH